MGYAILRFQKCKSLTQIRGIIKHNLRQIPVAVNNSGGFTVIYTSTIKENTAPYKTYSEFYKSKTKGIKTRKDSVKMIETIATYSPGSISDYSLNEWIKETVKYLITLFGENNIYRIVLHTDESTPHLHIESIPMTKDGKLSASAILGSPSKLRDIQSEYALKMAKFGLERGIDKRITKSVHQSSRAWKRQNAEKEEQLQCYKKTFGNPSEWDLDTVVNFNKNKAELKKSFESSSEKEDYEKDF